MQMVTVTLNHPRCNSLFHVNAFNLFTRSDHKKESDRFDEKVVKLIIILSLMFVQGYKFLSNSNSVNSFDRLVSLPPLSFFAPRKPFARKYLFFHPFAHFLTTRRFHNTGNDEPVYTAEIRIERYSGPVPSVSLCVSRVRRYQHWPAFVYIVSWFIYVPGTLY